MKSRILRQKQRLTGQSAQFLFPVRAAGVDHGGNLPAVVGVGAFGGLRAENLRPEVFRGMKVGGVDERNVGPGGQA